MNDQYKSPAYKLIIDGLEITALIRGYLISLTLTDCRGFEADQLDINLDDSSGNLAMPERGAVAELWLGWQGEQLIYKGKYTVDEISHAGTPDVLTIRARSADLTSGLNTQRERAWHNTSVASILNTIADEVDLTAVVSKDLAIKAIAHIDQTNESNANFLTRLAEQFDAISTVKDGKLLFTSRAAGTSASGKPLPVVLITRAVGDSHSFNVADRQSYNGVRATYHDISAAIKGEVLWTLSDDKLEKNQAASRAAQPIKLVGQYKTIGGTFKTRARAKAAARKEWKRLSSNAKLSQGIVGVKANYNDRNLSASGTVTYGKADADKRKSNAQRLAARDNAKLNAQPTSAIEATGDNIKTLRHVYASKEGASRAARNAWRKIQRGMAEFNINLAYGNAELFPEMSATVSGFKPQIDNTDWLITKVTHSLSDGGFTTHLDFEIKATEVD